MRTDKHSFENEENNKSTGYKTNTRLFGHKKRKNLKRDR